MDPEEVVKPQAPVRPVTFQDVLKGAALPGFAIAIVIMVEGFLNLGPSWNYISGTIPGYLSAFANQSTLLLAWVLIFVAVLYTLVTLYHKPPVQVFERIKPESKDNNYFGYIAAFVFFELAISVVISATGVVPSLQAPDDAAAIAYGISSVIFSILMQLIVIYPLLLLFREVRRRNEQFTSAQSDAAVLLISFPIDGALAYFTGMFSGFDVIFLITVLIMNYICIKTGFLKAFLTNITMNMISVASYIFVTATIANTVIAIYLYVWSFLGIFWASGVAFARVPQRAREEVGAEEGTGLNGSAFRDEHLVDLWIRSTCPGCGEAKFHVQQDLSLKCEKCGAIIQKDQIGVQNIVVQTRRAYR